MRTKGIEVEASFQASLPSRCQALGRQAVSLTAFHHQLDTRSRAHEQASKGCFILTTQNNAESHQSSFVSRSTELTNIFELSCVFLAVCSFLKGPQSTEKLPRTIVGEPAVQLQQQGKDPS